MIGYFGDIIFETSDKKICNFNDFKQAASANYSEHSRYRKKSEREFIGPNNEGVSFTMKIRAGHGVRPRIMKDKLIKYCEKNNKIPVVIHSHLYAEKEVSFSTIDLNFEHEFHHVQEILNYSVNSVFIVYGKTQSYARLCLKNKSMPFLMEDQINCITYREGSI